MVQQGQTIELTRRGLGGERLWAYRYRTGGRDSKRVQRGGFASEQDARDALERELERLRRERRIARRLTLTELVETYLAQHDVQPVTIEKLRYLLSKATAVFGDRKIGELTSQEIAEWRMRLSPGTASSQRRRSGRCSTGMPPLWWTPERLVGCVRPGGKDAPPCHGDRIIRSRIRRSFGVRRSRCIAGAAGR